MDPERISRGLVLLEPEFSDPANVGVVQPSVGMVQPSLKVIGGYMHGPVGYMVGWWPIRF